MWRLIPFSYFSSYLISFHDLPPKAPVGQRSLRSAVLHLADVQKAVCTVQKSFLKAMWVVWGDSKLREKHEPNM